MCATSLRAALPMAATELIPHRKPMALVDRLLACTDDDGVAEAVIGEDCPLLTAEGRLEEVALVELLAQSFAAANGYTRRQSGSAVRKGFLVGIRGVELLGRARRGDRLQIAFHKSAEIGDFVLVDGEVTREGEVLARGSLKLWLEPIGAATEAS